MPHTTGPCLTSRSMPEPRALPHDTPVDIERAVRPRPLRSRRSLSIARRRGAPPSDAPSLRPRPDDAREPVRGPSLPNRSLAVPSSELSQLVRSEPEHRLNLDVAIDLELRSTDHASADAHGLPILGRIQMGPSRAHRSNPTAHNRPESVDSVPSETALVPSRDTGLANGLRFCCAAPTMTSEAYRQALPRQ